MSLAATEARAAAPLPRLDWSFLIASVLAAAVLIALVLVDGQPAAAALIALGFALGVVFLKAEFSFTASWRRLIVRGQADGFLGGLLLIAIAAAAIVPVARLVPGFGGAIAPLGPSLLIGAFVFGIGMQLANGCGSGTLYTVGGGSGRMIVTLAFFIAGSVIGSLHLPAFLRLGGVDPILAADYLGPWGGLAVTWASLAVAAFAAISIARRRGASFAPSRRIAIGAVLIGLLSIGVFAAGHHPWSVTFGFTVWGAKLAALAGFDFSAAEFWQWPGPKRALGELDPQRHLEPHGPGDDLRRDGRCSCDRAVRAQSLAAAEIACRSRHRRPADGLGRAARLRLQRRSLRRRHRLRLTARLGLVRGGAARLPDRHQAQAAVRPVARVARCDWFMPWCFCSVSPRCWRII